MKPLARWQDDVGRTPMLRLTWLEGYKLRPFVNKINRQMA